VKVEIACEAGTIRMSDRRLSIGDNSSFGDVLEELVAALKSVTGGEELTLSKGEFGFQLKTQEDEPDPLED
jgi:hypothetical protein